MRIEQRIDHLARRLAGSGRELSRPTTMPNTTIESAVDGLARALAVPVTRRRALAVGGGAVAASMLRPGRARGAATPAPCPSDRPKKCSNDFGAQVCVTDDLQCCSNQYCAIACPYPWRDCERPGNCKDTARMCSDPRAPGYSKANTKFCSQRVAVTNGCVSGGMSSSLRGWCCKPRETCGSEFGTCTCEVECGEDCCPKNEECVSLGAFGFGGEKCLPKCKPGWHHKQHDCVCDSGQTCGLNCCAAGSSCVGSSCAAPKQSDSLIHFWDGFGGFFDSINQTAASRGGGQAGDAHVAAMAPIDAALLALAAVNTQGQAAASSFTDEHLDGGYRRRVRSPRAAPPPIVPGPGLDPRAAAALHALVSAEAKGFAQALACATALARARGALRHKDVTAARRQVLSAAGFASKAARALRPAPSLRAVAAATLRATGTGEVTATPGQVSFLHGEVLTRGIPADLRAVLVRLGVEGQDLVRARRALERVSSGGPALIAPLEDPVRTRNLQSLAAELARFAREARRTPITRSHPQPSRYRPRRR